MGKDLPYRACVGVVLLNGADLVWAGERADIAEPAWQLPQGGIDPGETPETAALRELEEETGIPAESVTVLGQTEDWIRYDLPADLVGKAFGGKYRGQTQKWFLLRFGGPDSAVNIRTAHPEFRNWAWLTPAEVLDRIVPFKAPGYRQVLTAFNLL